MTNTTTAPDEARDFADDPDEINEDAIDEALSMLPEAPAYEAPITDEAAAALAAWYAECLETEYGHLGDASAERARAMCPELYDAHDCYQGDGEADDVLLAAE